MISTTTKYGQFVINGYSDILTVGISRKGDESPQELVKKAIMFAKEYKCDICRKVEYTYKDGVTFKVKCSGNTSCHIYELLLRAQDGRERRTLAWLPNEQCKTEFFKKARKRGLTIEIINK